MIYSAEANMVPLVENLVLALKPYAEANRIGIFFQSNTGHLTAAHHPFSLIQSLSRLICQIINLVPHQSEIHVRLAVCDETHTIQLDVENTGINLMAVTEISNQCSYLFRSQALEEGTLYRLTLPLFAAAAPACPEEEQNGPAESLPKFYAEVRKRLRSHFSQADKLVAALAELRPQEAAFLQKINALIAANLQHEQFDSTALSKAMAMSRTQLFRRLKPLIRQAPAQYIKSIRLQKAKEMLETADLTVGEVAFKTGFQTQSHFTKVFLQRYGVLPSAFKRKGNGATNG